jgi:hypothetical protein
MGDSGVEGRITENWIFKKCRMKVQTGVNWVKIGSSVGLYEHGNEPSCSIKDGEFLD